MLDITGMYWHQVTHGRKSKQNLSLCCGTTVTIESITGRLVWESKTKGNKYRRFPPRMLNSQIG